MHNGVCCVNKHIKCIQTLRKLPAHKLECHSNINVRSMTPAGFDSAARLTGMSKKLPSANGEAPCQTLYAVATDWGS